MFKLRPALLFLSLISLPAAAVAQTNFGPVTLGQTATIPVTVRFTVAGTLQLADVNTLGVSSRNSAFTQNQFSLGNGTTCKFGAGYSVGQTCTIDINFHPTSPGTQYGAVFFRNTLMAIKATAFFRGTGIGPLALFSPSDYGPSSLPLPSKSGPQVLLDPIPIAFGSQHLYSASGNGNGYFRDASIMDPTIDNIPVGKVASLAVDAADDLFLADGSNARVVEVRTDGTTASFSDPYSSSPNIVAVTVDGSGNLFILDGASSTVIEYPGANSSATPIAIHVTVDGEPLGLAANLALDSAGNLFLTDTSRNALVELTAAQVAGGGGDGALIAPVADGKPLNGPTALALDRADTLFISDFGNKRIVVVPSGGNAPYSFVPTDTGIIFGGAGGITTGIEGDVYLTDPANNLLFRVNRTEPTPLKFPITGEGTTSLLTVKLSNGGTAPLAIGSITFPPDFQEASNVPSACSTTATVAPGASCDLPIEFAPATTGSFSGYVHLYDNSKGLAQNLQEISVAGIAAEGTLALSASTLDFGTQIIGTSSASQQVTLTNNTASPVQIAAFGILGAGQAAFVFASDCPSSLPVHASCTIHGHFSPTAAQAYSALVSIGIKGLGSETITVTGQGVSPQSATVSALSIAYGSEPVGTASPSQSITLQNTGGGPLHITGIKVVGTNASSFIIGYDCPGSLAAGASCTIHGHFTPATAGNLTAAINITTNSTTPIAPVTLTGTGTAPAASLASIAPGLTAPKP